ncbi:MAG: glycosyl hydrolase [Pseudomonadota bacterium]
MRKITQIILLVALVVSVRQPVSAQVMLGAYLPGDGWRVEEIHRFNQVSAKPLAFVTFFTAFSHNWREQLNWQASKIYSTGAIPLVSWMPVDVDDPDRNLLPEIAAGKWDNYIDQWIDGLLSWLGSYPESKRPMILLRFGHEFNGHWYPYSGEPMLYVVAWRRIHDRFQQAGANEFVEWVWNMNHISFDNHNDVTRYYPGDHYVDWTAIDGYNWGTNHDWTNWDSFEQVFAAAYDTLVDNYPDKPILIAEFGTTEPTDVPTARWGQHGSDVDNDEIRAEWFFDMLESVELHFPAIRGLGLFGNDKELSWSLTSESSTGLEGFNLGLQSDHYTSSFLCARIMPPDTRLPQIESPVILSGPANLVPRELLNPTVFSHAVSTKRPPRDVVRRAKIKSSDYRSKVRAISRQQRASIAIKRMEVIEYPETIVGIR